MNDPPAAALDDKNQNDEKQQATATSGGSSKEVDNSSKNSSRSDRKIPIVTTPKRGISGASSSDDDDLDDDDGDEEFIRRRMADKIPSFHNSQGTPVRDSDTTNAASNETATPNSPPTTSSANGSSTGVSADQERQILLLMLLAQVCALHDPTPRTFTVHVLELFERGILGRQSIHFLFELGLVPSSTPRLLPPSTTTLEGDSKETEILDLAAPTSPQTQRAQEASAIRSHLEQHDLAQQSDDPRANLFHADTTNQATLIEKSAAAQSWAVEHHPLSLSRYLREFQQQSLLNSGSFGEVFHSTNKIDLKDYAVKRVAFSAWGYSKDSVGQVIREVHCLAQCDHPNVVRYYTSWLEPSWMTGSGATTMMASGTEVRRQQKLLTDIQHMMVSGAADPSSAFTSEEDFFQEEAAPNRQAPARKFSIGSSIDDSHSFDSGCSSYDETSSSEEEDYNNSTWSVEDTTTHREESILFASSTHPKREAWESSSSPPRQAKKKAGTPTRIKYRYQICLFIQMQLCHPATLGDWIRHRNAQCPDPNQGRRERVEKAIHIFSQIASGLAHIHKKNVVHRDLKPHNLFRSLEDDGAFLIGDFGLSKLIHSATHQQSTKKKKSQQSPVFSSPTTADSSAVVCHQAPMELTEGVGTASYAAPEQVTTRTYGKRADIFSLGLILLEMMCRFTTEHERMQTFYDCRHRRDIPEWISMEYPIAGKTILDCTNPSPLARPTAEELLAIDLLRSSAPAIGESSSSDEVTTLKLELEQKNEQILAYEQLLKEKDQAIAQLQQELAQCKLDQTAATETRRTVPDPMVECVGIHLASAAQVESSSSSIEDGV